MSHEIANTIVKQLGSRAFAMMGTQWLTKTENSIKFNLRGGKVNEIEIIYNYGADDYTIKYFKGTKLVAEVDGLYADMLKSSIEYRAGLYLSL